MDNKLTTIGLLSMVGIVAIVGLLVLFLSGFSTSATMTLQQQANQDSLAGNAFQLAASKEMQKVPSPTIETYMYEEDIFLFYDCAEELFGTCEFEDELAQVQQNTKAREEFNQYIQECAFEKGATRTIQLSDSGFNVIEEGEGKFPVIVAVGIIGVTVIAIGVSKWAKKWCCKKNKPCCDDSDGFVDPVNPAGGNYA